jgi:hypothetical protein
MLDQLGGEIERRGGNAQTLHRVVHNRARANVDLMELVVRRLFQLLTGEGKIPYHLVYVVCACTTPLDSICQGAGK